MITNLLLIKRKKMRNDLAKFANSPTIPMEISEKLALLIEAIDKNNRRLNHVES